MHDLRPAARELTRLVDGVRDDQLGDPTPCTQYTLGDLLQHVRGLAEAFTLAGRKEQPAGGSQPPPQGDASLLPEDWRGEIAQWLERLVEAWADPTAWEGNAWIAGFEAPASAVGVTAANELAVHGWDMARASGQPIALDDAALAPAREFVAMMSGPGSEDSRGDAFGPALPVPAGASALDEVVAGNGRDPSWAADGVPRGDWLDQGPSDAREVADWYDEWAQSYDGDLASWSYRAPTVVAEAVVARCPGAGSVLDVGCGTGLVGRALRERGFEGRILGLDISQASLEIAQQSGAYDSLEHADLQQRLAVEDDSVDAVVCVGVMTYLPEVEAVWREFARVARPGGVVVATQREDLWQPRECQAVVDRLQDEGVWTPLEITGPAPYLPEGYGGTPEVGCYYLTAVVS